MNEPSTSQHPVIISILIALIPPVLLSVAGAVIIMRNLGTTASLFAQLVACVVSILIGILIAKKMSLSFADLGFRAPDRGSAKAVYFYIPAIVVVLLNIASGFSGPYGAAHMVVLVVSVASVGVNEELYFRGIILQRLWQLGVVRAIVIASVLFGLLHTVNLLGNYRPSAYVLLQVVFAFAFGLVAAEMVVITKSLWPVIAFHFANDLIGELNGQTVTTAMVVVTAAQVVILIAVAVALWRRAIAQQPAASDGASAVA
jgi:membrane protease YdiL (CAAX protease family)